MHRKKYCLLSITNVAAIGLFSMCIIFSYVSYENFVASKVFFGIAMGFMVLESILTGVLTFLALYKFLQVAKELQSIVTPQLWPVFVQIGLLIFWVACSVVIFI